MLGLVCARVLFFTLSGVRFASNQMQFASDLGSGFGSEDPFQLQMDSSGARSQITLEPIYGAEPAFSEVVTIFGRNFK